MSENVRQAAERLRNARRQSRTTPSQEWISDLVEVASAYLDEHPADDDEAVTEEWLRSVGFEEKQDERALSGGVRRKYIVEKFTCFIVDTCDAPLKLIRGDGFWWASCGWGFPDSGCGFPNQKTRGDVRRLCLALGITLTEANGT